MSFYLMYKNTYFRTRFWIYNFEFRIWSSEFETRNWKLFGTVAEGLGSALQKLLQQFESVRYLKPAAKGGFF